VDREAGGFGDLFLPGDPKLECDVATQFDSNSESLPDAGLSRSRTSARDDQVVLLSSDSIGGTPEEAGRCRIECFMAYEDLITGLRAKRAMERVLRADAECLSPRFELLRFDLLEQPELHWWAAREAAQSDVVVLSLHGEAELSEAVRSWLHQWTCQRQGSGVALVASLDRSLRQMPENSPAVAHLREVAARCGLALFTHFGGRPQPRVISSLQTVCRRLHHPVDDDDDAHFSDPGSVWSGWGINE
jgi:hypothetical protein